MKVRNKRAVAVTIAPAGAFTGIPVEAGGVVDVDDDLGASLLEQSDRWEAAGPTPDEKPAQGKEKE